MKLYQGDSCNNLYIQALKDCMELTNPTLSRVGLVYDLGPVAIEFEPKKLNLLTLNKRALNPFFAIAEAAWIIGGQNSLKQLNYYLKSYDDFSDDGVSLNGAYGFRLRKHFGCDQLQIAINQLKKSPNSRRCVLNMYEPDDLKNNTSKDIPCNTSIMLKIRNGALDLTVINRSNDIHWGVPYNLFVFQVLHCYLANKIGVKLGYQRHVIDSLHLYERNVNDVKDILNNNFNQFENKTLDLIYMVLNNVDSINNRDFKSITETPLRKAMMMYEEYKTDIDREYFGEDTGHELLNFLISEWAIKYINK
ncbi:thymidylate synthase [Aliivibrio fischeri]|uniref:thymidylate synthase n=1 Tax=Aliivibrio fischeri TaxID=668 RepID=UPI00080E4E44|nr:thymidylate synthase [Aliivibrio fischeri]OCH58394.1 thymidylate synthase [Aliivibrio fischeri]